MAKRVADPVPGAELVQHEHLGGREEAPAEQVLVETELQGGAEELDEETVGLHGVDVVGTVYGSLEAIALQVCVASCSDRHRERQISNKQQQTDKKNNK